MQRTKIQRAGFTLVEISISALVSGFILLAIVSAGKSAQDLSDLNMTMGEIGLDGARALNKMRPALINSGVDTLWPALETPFSSDIVEFRQVLSNDGEVQELGVLERIEARLAEGETLNGQDDNRDGLIDEYRVVWTIDVDGPDEREITLCTDVSPWGKDEVINGEDDNGNGLIDEAGFAVAIDGSQVSIDVNICARTDRGALVQQTSRALVRVRN